MNHGITFRRAAARCAAAIACVGLLAARSATADVGDAAEALRAALDAFAAELPPPESKAARKLLQKIEKAIAELDGEPSSLIDEVLAAAKAWKSVPESVSTDPDVAAAAAAVLDALVQGIESELAEVEAQLEPHGDPGPPLAAAVRVQIAKCREKLATAGSPVASAKFRFGALGGAAKKLAAVFARLAEFEESLRACGAAAHSDGILEGAATISVDDGPPVEVPLVSAQGAGSGASAGYSAAASALGRTFTFLVRGTPLQPQSSVPLTTQFDFEQGVRVVFSVDGMDFACDTGTFRITSIRLRKYPKSTPEPFTRYLEIAGSFSGSGVDASGQTETRASIDAEFSYCEIAFDLE